MRNAEGLHRALTSALVYIRDADKELKTAMNEARDIGKAGKVTGEIQTQLDVVEQLDWGVEQIILALMAQVV